MKKVSVDDVAVAARKTDQPFFSVQFLLKGFHNSIDFMLIVKVVLIRYMLVFVFHRTN